MDWGGGGNVWDEEMRLCGDDYVRVYSFFLWADCGQWRVVAIAFCDYLDVLLLLLLSSSLSLLLSFW